MAANEERIRVNKTFIDSENNTFLSNAPINTFAGKEVYFSPGQLNNRYVVFQLIGNLGGHPNDYEFNSTTDYFILGDTIYKESDFDYHEVIKDLERRLNQKGRPYKGLKIITESTLLEYCIIRNEAIKDSATSKLIKALK